MGSQKYPFKGVLDQLANRAGSDGTNAWTANDRELRTGLARTASQLTIQTQPILSPLREPKAS